jgi:thiamine biosynthesis lipoprotein
MKNSFLVLFLMSLALISCNRKKELQLVKFNGEAQGTYYSITYYAEDATNYQIQIDSILKAFDKSVSLWEPTSVICRVNNNDSTVILDSIFVDIFNKSMRICKETDGNFDITVGQLVNAWGFGFESRSKLNQHKVDSLLKFIGYENVELKNGNLTKNNPNIKIDFNAIAQGYSVDVISIFLESKGILNYLIDVGGEVLGKGSKPDASKWMVGIEKPTQHAEDERVLEAKIELFNRALATSGNYRKYYEENGVRYSHTIDPRTGYPVKHSLLSASVVANNTWEADAYATAFMVMGLEKTKEFLSKNKNIEAYLIYSDEEGRNKTYLTSGLKGILEEISN